MRAAAVALSLCLLLSGCRKKSAPEFYRFESDYQVLVARDGDAAYDGPDMAAIVTGLSAIPANALEKPKADALLATITAETTRVHAEAGQKTQGSTQPAANADAVYAEFQRERAAQAAAAAAEAEAAAAAAAIAEARADAGAPLTEPVKGMSEADFIKAFGGCFAKGDAVTMPDGAVVGSQRVRETQACLQKWGNGVMWVFGAQGLIGQLVQSSTTSTSQTVLDAGSPTLPPEPYRPLTGRPTGTPAPSIDDKQYLNDTPPPTVTPPAP